MHTINCRFIFLFGSEFLFVLFRLLGRGFFLRRRALYVVRFQSIDNRKSHNKEPLNGKGLKSFKVKNIDKPVPITFVSPQFFFTCFSLSLIMYWDGVYALCEFILQNVSLYRCEVSFANIRVHKNRKIFAKKIYKTSNL